MLEEMGCFGGMGTAGGLPVFCSFTDGRNFVADGFGRDLYHRLRDAGGIYDGSASFHMPEGYPYFDTPYFKGEVLKRVYDDMVRENGAEFAFYTQFLAPEVATGRVQAIICAGKSGLFAVQAQVFIDCTGDGDLCARAGAPFEKGDAEGQMQPGTLCSVWAGVDWQAAKAAGFGAWSEERHLPRAFADKVFTIEDAHLPGLIPIGEGLGGGNIGHTFGVDGTDERSLTEAMVWGRKVLLEYERFYKEYLSGYERMELAATAALLGVRETRRITGDYVLNVEDFVSRAVFDDEIGRFAYPVDVHASRPGQQNFDQFRQDFEKLRYQPGESYGIPYRCLTPRGLENVLAAGRCISADRYIQGSIRVMPGCFITGQAAGMAAALASEGKVGTREISVAELQGRLRKVGAYLPNAMLEV